MADEPAPPLPSGVDLLGLADLVGELLAPRYVVDIVEGLRPHLDRIEVQIAELRAAAGRRSIGPFIPERN